jgi:hypothetical protein
MALKKHWQDVRERAAIAALGGLLANTNLVSEVIKVAVDYANALVKRLKEAKL